MPETTLLPDKAATDPDEKLPSTIAGRRKKRRHRAGPPVGREFRRFAAQGLEVRSATDGSDQIEIVGTPIVYNVGYTVVDMFGAFEETMHAGVASNLLAAGCDTRFLLNHDGLPMARTLPGTLVLTDGIDGLGMVALCDARQQLANDLAVAIERGDVTQMSCGFIVASDEWTSDYTQRDIYRFEELFDVSAVTYPASPTTSIELALRSMMAAPVESRARVRKLWQVGTEIRAGKVLSAANATLLQDALEALHQADDVDIPSIVSSLQTIDDAVDKGQAGLAAVLDKINPDDDEETEVSSSTSDDGSGGGSQDPMVAGIADGTGSRSAPATAAERRAADRSFNDIERAVSDALSKAYAPADDEYCDLWLEDCGDGWAVFHSWETNPGVGLWRISYTLDDAGAAVLGDDLTQVVEQTSYVPVEQPDDQTAEQPAARSSSLTVLALEAERMQLRGRRHRRAS